jgi:hypothetical protein
MLQMAQDVFKMLRDRLDSTLRVVADLAEAVGVPPTLTSLLVKRDEGAGAGGEPFYPERRSESVAPSRAVPIEGDARCECDRADAPCVEEETDDLEEEAAVAEAMADREAAEDARDGNGAGGAPQRRRVVGKRRGLVGEKDLSGIVRPLEVDDSIGGSTYLARIVWSLGVADLEGTGPLRPADMARMIMSRSAVSLEPPNVARYIRRSKPREIEVDRVEGGSSFYRLTTEGRSRFDEKFRIDKR